MAQNVQFILDADEGKAVQSFLKVVRSQKQAEGQTKRTAQAMNRQDKVQQRVAQSAKRIGGAIAGALGAGGVAVAAVRQLINEYDNLIQRQEKARKQLENLAGAESNLIGLTTGLSDQQQQQLRGQIRQLANQRGLPRRELTQAAAEAFSATSSPDPSQRLSRTVSAVRGATFLRPSAPQEIPQIAGAIIDLQKQTGFTDPRAATGFFNILRSQARVGSVKKLARSAPSAIAGITSLGGDVRTAAALFSATGSAAAEATGEATRSSLIGLARSTKQFFGRDDVQDPGDLSSRIRRLQQDQQVRQRFLEAQPQSSFVRGVEKQFEGVIRDLILKPDSQVSETFFGTQGLFTREESVKRFRRLQRRRGENVPFQSQRLGQRFGRLESALLETRGQDARAATIRNALQPILQAAGESDIAQRFSRVGFEASTRFGKDQPGQAAVDILRQIVSERRREAQRLTAPFGVRELTLGPGSGSQVRRFGTREAAREFAQEGRTANIGGAFRRDISERDRERAEQARETAQTLAEQLPRLVDQIAQLNQSMQNDRQRRDDPPATQPTTQTE